MTIFNPIVIAFVMSFTYSRVFTERSSAQGMLSSAFYRLESGLLLSNKNVTIKSRSFLDCLVTGKVYSNCLAVNYLENRNSCELVLESDANPRPLKSSEDSFNWVHVTFSQDLLPKTMDSTTYKTIGCVSGSLGQFNGKCYTFYTANQLPMYDSLDYCETQGGKLLAIETQLEQEFICSSLEGKGGIWTSGMFDKNVAFWAATSLDMAFTSWAGGSLPGGDGNSAVYMDLSSPGCPWKVERFTQGKNFICEFDI